MDTINRGQLVVLRDVDGMALIRVVWSYNQRGVFILTENEYNRRLQGKPSLDPVGFPFPDVFLYHIENSGIVEDSKLSGAVDWDRMIPVTPELLDRDRKTKRLATYIALDMPVQLKHNMFINRLDSKTRAAVISALVEGCSIRSTCRMTGASKPTVLKLLVEAGAMASKIQDKLFRNLTCKRVQVDEMWAFIAAKQRNVTPTLAAKNPHAGDVWLWVAIDADTKLVPSWMLGKRNWATAQQFAQDIHDRISNRIQLSSDGLRWYFHAISYAFGQDIDYGVLRKIYGSTPGEVRYSPAEIIGCEREPKIGNPDPDHISTSYAERQNLSVRMGIRRYTRLTNAFSRKMENHAAAVALYYFSYNLVKIHGTLRVTPAMAAGVTNRPWEVSDLVAMLEAEERPSIAA